MSNKFNLNLKRSGNNKWSEKRKQKTLQMFCARTQLLLGVLVVQAALVDFSNDSFRVSSIKLLAYGQITEYKSDYETWAHLLWQTVAYIIKRLMNVLHGAKTPVWWEGNFDESATQPVNTGKMCSHPGTKLADSTLILAAALCC